MTHLQSLLAKMYQVAVRIPGISQHCSLPSGLHIRMRYEDGMMHLLVVRKNATASRAEYLTVANSMPIPADLQPAVWKSHGFGGHIAIWTPLERRPDE